MTGSEAMLHDPLTEVARRLGLEVSDEPRAITVARIRDAVAVAVGEKAPAPATTRQLEYGLSLGLDLAGRTSRIASAWIGYTLRERNHEAIEQLGLRPGMRVAKTHQAEVNGETLSFDSEHVISSIGDDGRLFFKGGNGQGAWPTQVRIVEEPGASSVTWETSC